MGLHELDEAPYLDVFSDEFREDPRPRIDEVRAQGWLARTPIGCVVIGRKQVHDLLLDSRLQSAVLPFIQMQGVTSGPLFDSISSTVLVLDGEDHARLRRLVTPSLTPKAVNPHRPLMRELLESIVASFAETGRCEFMVDVADKYPIQVMCHVLGVPPQDHERFARWGDALTHILSIQLTAHMQEVTEAFEGLFGYVDDLVAERRREPRDDLVSHLIAARDGSDRLTEEELGSMIGGLLFAGYDTTRNQLGLAMWLFSENPEQWKLLCERPELASNAVEEVMRMAGATGVVPRIPVEDLEVDGWRIPTGTLVSLSLSGANHDPAFYDDPFTFDITAEREPQFTFGGGAHHCMGANLARAEMQEALPILARRLPAVALDGEPVWRSYTGIYGPDRLPLKFTASGD